MRTFLPYLMTIAGLPISLILTAQPNYFDNDPVWGQTSICAVPAPCIENAQFNYLLCGDTTIAGLDYKKVCKQGWYTLNWQAGQPAGSCVGTHGIPLQHVANVRQDAHRIYLHNGSMDTLLFDFDLQVGDTLPPTANNWTPDITVISIDSFAVNAGWLHQFELSSNSWATHLIEGVGSTHGLLEPISNFLECGYTLDCYGQAGAAYYPGPGPSCELAMGLFPSLDGEGSEVFVSMSNGRIVVSYSATATVRGAQLLDSSGRLLHQFATQENTLEMDASRLTPGSIWCR